MALSMLPRTFGSAVQRKHTRSLMLSMLSTLVPSDNDMSPGARSKTPVTVLSGFLGAGKTSFLHHTLNNQDGLKFGLVVNDMATVNVDAKQIRQQSFDEYGGIDTMELQDGCVCCTLAEDLIASVSKLVSMSDLKGYAYNHIVVECSGIAEPRKIRDLFQQAEDYNYELLNKIQLDTLVTLVDASVFLELFGTDQDVAKNRKLAYRDTEDDNGVEYIDPSGQRKITDLLLEQVECADIILINKCDLLENPGDLDLVKKVINSINPNAKVLSCVKGEVEDPLSLIGSAHAQGAADWGILDEHRNLVKAVEDRSTTTTTAAACSEPGCTDPTHDHDHSHSHGHSHGSSTSTSTSTSSSSSSADCSEPGCTDPTHDHDHSHSHGHSHGSSTSTSTSTSSSSSSADCSEPGCTDPTHDHDHSHSHGHSHATTAEERFGITSFVYKRRKPFHPIRFSKFLQGLGNLSIKGMTEWSEAVAAPSFSAKSAAKESTQLLQAKRALLRSKGFVWMATSGAAAYFMSHAGQYLELVVLGRWWADIDSSEWPAGMEQEITTDFGGAHGDRRQELVFIGQFAAAGASERQSQQALEEVLDSCLLTDEEMQDYERVVKEGGDDALRELFVPET